MTTQWKYKQGNEELGPVTSRQLKQLAAAGRLTPDDLVWKEGLADWVSARRVQGLFEPNTTNAAAALSGINLAANVEKLDLGAKPKKSTTTSQGSNSSADSSRHRDIPTFPDVGSNSNRTSSPQREPHEMTPPRLPTEPVTQHDVDTNCPYCNRFLDCEGLVGEFICPNCDGRLSIPQPGSQPVPIATLPPVSQPPPVPNRAVAQGSISSHPPTSSSSASSQRPVQRFEVGTNKDPITGILSLVGALAAWLVFGCSIVIVAIVRRNINVWTGATEEQQTTVGLAVLAVFGALAIGTASGVLGLIATIQSDRSRVTGIIGLVASGILLLGGLIWFVTI